MARVVLLKTATLERASIYGAARGERFKLSECEPEIEVYRREVRVPMLGGAGVKKTLYSLIICVPEINESELKNISAFEISGEVRRSDGIYEVLHFDSVSLNEIRAGGEWVFSAEFDGRARACLLGQVNNF